MNNPLYLDIDGSGDLYICDTGDFAIRKIDSSGAVSTIAGIDDPNAVPPVLATGGGTATSTSLNQPLSIAFDPGDNLYIADGGYSASDLGYDIVWEVDNGLTEAKPQTITFPPFTGPVQYGVGQVALDATASSGLPVQYTATGPAFVSGSGSSSVLNVTAAGTVAIAANQGGDPQWSPATPVTQTLVVNKATLTVAAPADASKRFGQPNPAFVATYGGFIDSDSQASSLTGQPSITTTATTSSPAGTYPITIGQGSLASSNYSFSFVNGTLTVTGATTQTISFAALPPIIYGHATSIVLNATATSSLPVEFTVVSGPATVSGSTLSITGGGTIVITATQAGNNTYAGASPVTQRLVVNPAPLTVTAPSLSLAVGSTVTPSTFPAPSISGFAGSDGASLVVGSATYGTNANAASPIGAYTITVARGTLDLVPEAAGDYTFTTFVPGTLTITPPTQTITYTPLPAVSYGSLFQVTASASSNLPVTFAVSGPLAIQGSNVTIPNVLNYVQILATGVGPATITMTQGGDAQHAPATPVSVNINVGQAELDVQANNQIIEQGAALPVFTYQIGQNVPGFIDIPSIVSGIPVLITSETPDSPPGTYPITVSMGTLTSPYYYFNFVSGTLTVTPPGSFTIAASPSTLTIPSGMSAQTTITLTAQNAYQGTVTMTCGQVPANVTCTVSPSTYTFPGSQNPDGSENAAQGTVTINTTTSALAKTGFSPRSPVQLAAVAIPGVLSGFLLVFARRQTAHGSSIWTCLLLLAIGSSMSLLVSCGGASHGANNTASKGTATITISGTGTTPSGASFVTSSLPLTLVIQ